MPFCSSTGCCLCNTDGRSVFGQGKIIQFARFYEGEQRESSRRHNQLFGDDRMLDDSRSAYPMLKRSASHDNVHTSVRYEHIL